jgi:hypothetical protein
LESLNLLKDIIIFELPRVASRIVCEIEHPNGLKVDREDLEIQVVRKEHIDELDVGRKVH